MKQVFYITRPHDFYHDAIGHPAVMDVRTVSLEKTPLKVIIDHSRLPNQHTTGPVPVLYEILLISAIVSYLNTGSSLLQNWNYSPLSTGSKHKTTKH